MQVSKEVQASLLKCFAVYAAYEHLLGTWQLPAHDVYISGDEDDWGGPYDDEYDFQDDGSAGGLYDDDDGDFEYDDA